MQPHLKIGQLCLSQLTISFRNVPKTIIIVNSELESSHRIQMIENSFGTAGRQLNDGSRLLFAEGFLMKRSKESCKRRHFFLFSDMLLWGSVIKAWIINLQPQAQLRRGARGSLMEATKLASEKCIIQFGMREGLK